MKKISVIIILYFILQGCTSTPTNAPSTIDFIDYGMNIKQVAFRTDHPGKPLYKFITKEKKYYVVLQGFKDISKSYLFLYENNILVSIISVNSGVKIWEENFGKYKNSIPNHHYFSGIVKAFKENAIKDKSKINIFKRGKKLEEGSTGANLMEIGSTWGMGIPGVLPLVMGSTIFNSASDGISNLSSVKFKSAEFYKNLLLKANKLKFQNSKSKIISVFGRPSNVTSNDELTLLIYKGEDTKIFGLINNMLQWIAFDYPIKLSNSE